MSQQKNHCTEISALWCPIHGDCICKDEYDLNDDYCPLHHFSSEHGRSHEESKPKSRVSREICKICYKVNSVGFDIPDENWKAVVPPALQSSVVCLNCYTRLADELLIPWDEDIKLFPVSLSTHLGGIQ